jgi:hypothetical protein
LQEIICRLGQGYVFEEGSEILKALLGLDISANQIQRVSEYYGQEVESLEQQDSEKAVLKLKNPEEPVYVMFDGGMVLTRENEWMEMKVGRAFAQSSCVPIQPGRKAIMHSDYVCHLGGCKDFLEKWERHIEPYDNKIFIADGAKWIWNYVEDAYPQSVQILDFFHAVEKLGTYANTRYPTDETYRKEWIHVQKQRLLNNETDQIIKELEKATTFSREATEALKDVTTYFKNNESRMQYQSYLQAGYLIGSGAMEAAHRNVVQQRLKLSGQRWTIGGAQKIVNLRAYKKSNQWHKVTALIKKAA